MIFAVARVAVSFLWKSIPQVCFYEAFVIGRELPLQSIVQLPLVLRRKVESISIIAVFPKLHHTTQVKTQKNFGITVKSSLKSLKGSKFTTLPTSKMSVVLSIVFI